MYARAVRRPRCVVINRKKRKNFVSPLSDGHLNGVAVERRRKQNRHDHYHIITYINTNISNFVLYICSLFKPKFTLLLFLWRGKRLSYSEQFKKVKREKYKNQLTLIFSSWENMGTMPERIFFFFY